MNIQSVEKKNGNAKIVVVVDKEKFESAINSAYLQEKKKIMVPGFRKGHAPRKIIESMYGKGVFYEEAINILFPEIYDAAVTEQKLKAVGAPSIADMEVAEDRTLTLTVETALYPEVKLGTYKGVEAPKAEVKVLEADVKAELERMAQRASRIQTVERAAKLGDTVMLDFEGFVDGKAFEGGKGEKYNLQLGSGQFIPGFEDALVGVKAGEDRDVEVTFPEAYTPELAGKNATFKCKIHEVKETIVPKLDDEFAKDVSEFDTLADLKKDIKARLKKDREEAVMNEFENEVVTAAAENMTCEIPACMIDEQVDQHMEQFAYRLQQSGMTMADYAKMMGGDLQALRANMRPMAEKTVRANILLSEIVEKENIEVTDEEIAEEFKKLAEMYQMKEEDVKKAIKESALRADLATKKAVRLIVDNAKAVAPKKEDDAEKPAAKKPAAKKTAETAEKPAAKKTAAKKTAETAEKPAAKKTAAKKTTETAEKKPAAKKPAAKKTETAEKKTETAKKPAAKKTTKKAEE
ncbi:MAG: trigger factor [Oscillospiraceae bacterium]|nr:trigger factor [Oscillospiraceae bacterium]